MDLEYIVDKVFIISVIVSVISLAIFISIGIKLSLIIKGTMPDLFIRLGRPYGVVTLLMRSTALYEKFINKGQYKKYENIEIRRFSEIIILAKKYFHISSFLCLTCMLFLLGS